MRRGIGIGLLAVAAWAAGRTGKSAFDEGLREEARIRHALARLTFGARPGDEAAIRKTGLKAWIEGQLNPGSVAENPLLAEKLKPLESLAMDTRTLMAAYPPRRLLQAVQAEPAPAKEPAAEDGRKVREEVRKLRASMISAGMDMGIGMESVPAGQRLLIAAPGALRREILRERQPVLVAMNDLLEGKLYRAVYSNRQLEEVLTDFWFNHFNVFWEKGFDRVLVTSYERDAIRPHVLGRFRDLLQATAESPAMLFYLDNFQSVDPTAMERIGRRFPEAQRRTRGLNENYARELLELHTMGVDGGYTQEDVVNVARCFTGWTIAGLRQGDARFQFNGRVHDRGEKRVLGVKIPAGGGKEDGLKVLEILSRHRSTARFISYRLAQRFVADEPPTALVERMAATFARTDGDLREVMRTMIASREFFSKGAWQAKVKSPLEMVVSAVRALDAGVDNAYLLAHFVGQLGQPLYRKVEPTGYPNSSGEWLNSATLVARLNFAMSLTANRLPGVAVDLARYEKEPAAAIAKALLPDGMSKATRETIEDEPGGVAAVAGLLIGSPEFQRR